MSDSDTPREKAIRRQVSPLELFFDLVFVFAVSQLAHHLVEHLTWRGAAETAVLLVAVFGTWAFTSFEATLLDITRPRTRFTVLAVMGLGLFMNAAISRAFAGSAWLFVVPLLLIMIGVQALAAFGAPTKDMRRHYQRGLVWTATSAPLWVVGATQAPGPRLWWWAAAALIDLTGTWLAHPLPGRVLHSTHLDFDAEHMLERLRLFLILLLGETVLTIGRTMAVVPVDAPAVLASAGVFVALVSLWAVYFGGGEDVVAVHVARTSDPIRSVRWGINVTYCALAALVTVAVASELVISHPLDQGSVRLALVLFGGPVLYLASQAWYYHATTRQAWAQRLMACAVCVPAAVASLWLPSLVSLVLLDLILVTTAVVLSRAHRRLADALRSADGAPA
ncbi:membrane protein [Streptomyces cinereoruber]|uniref:Low temperature requirement protein A n=1 Tax=Streptomyces cinereoruber TaxID=67260 RepID=A0AAV4KTA2_9ACTN|nr:low temperature requirement protein A [Streptomyces cinereoruber]MBB4158222.1 low temperature requirement protein LtrA [Streptomyces cinereoruber]MBY8819244.1 low temperature requirement protein A [Streptomyces cinereoruber]NIH63355.1 low temperature requirement protein LtrA [Streptomyces cinereoruber]QEV36013.1 low temperature requirement protein A [Streptomyces cinereoruber]GGR50353.1 membrane protein [Streptomyces cinereoruber]